MSNIAIHAEQLSKYYKLGVINNGTLFRDLQTWFALKRGKQDPHSRIDENKYDPTKEGFWALTDVCFDIKQGDRVGIIGKNGAGKSTLLKILSRITAPTEGTIKIKGRIASLLEVGTGFHGELTGRENIYLNGAILGMKRREVARKLDEIIAFSEIEQYIDTPVKRYSSGMYVRLAFAVAAHLDSEILIADEVLAVGDASFQKKALGKMSDLSTGQGRTVLFVSHQMSAVKSLCNKGIILEKGRIVAQNDNIDLIIKGYLGEVNDTDKKTIWTNDGSIRHRNFTPQKIELLEEDGSPLKEILTAERSYKIQLEFDVEEVSPLLTYDFHIYSSETLIFCTTPLESIKNYTANIGKNIITCFVPAFLLNKNLYRIELHASLYHKEWILHPQAAIPNIFLTINSKNSISPFQGSSDTSMIKPNITWNNNFNIGANV